ncbi:trypsin-like serine protease [Pseudoalteromonas sp. B95]|nr:trypsin-like serine protease [Pseudoalteromonas sp. B95]MDK1288397.1 trypsin-like serine protease [Pseudoalteromonas sp. B95]
MKYIFLLLSFVSYNASAILIRHDIEDKEYLAKPSDFPALITFYIDGAHGSLIKPNWVVTAAHTTFCLEPGTKIKTTNGSAIVKRLHVHPKHTPGVSHDIALVELSESINEVRPAKLYQETNEAGRDIWFIGIGGTGNGIAGITVDNYDNKGVLRKAQNRVEQAKGPILTFKFDNGETALPFEGISGGGDSGGPAYFRQGNDYYVMGLSSRYGGGPSEKYNSLEVYSRVSYFMPWINGVMTDPENSIKLGKSLDKLKHLPGGLRPSDLPSLCKDILFSEKELRAI